MSFLNVTCLTPLLLCPIEMFETFISFPLEENPPDSFMSQLPVI